MAKEMLLEKDYEKYRFTVPVKFLIGKSRTRYVCSQLEKMHPCFSEKCCYDEKLKLSRKGFIADVTVMERLRLGEYKAKFPRADLYCADDKHKAVFSSKKKTVIAVGLTVILVAVALILITGPGKAEKNRKNSAETEKMSENTEGLKPFSDTNLLKDFFLCLVGQGGKVSDFQWTFTGEMENCSLHLENCYPDGFMKLEKFDLIMFSPLVYKKSLPDFSVSFSSTASSVFQDAESEADFEYRGKIRGYCRMNDMNIVGEVFKPYSITLKFNCGDKEKTVDKLRGLQRVVLESNISVRSLSLSKDKNNEATLELAFASMPVSEATLILDFVADYWSVFQTNGTSLSNETNVKVEKSSKVSGRQVRNSSVKKSENEGKKIGTIIHPDGSKTVYYKDRSGKIKNESNY